MVGKSSAWLLAVALVTSPAAALIMGSDGDEPIEIEGWPEGAAEIFNVRERVAYWEGPPFGGGQYHAECRGDTEKLNAVLEGFGKLKSENKRIVVQDGVGRSFWLNPNNEPEKRKKSRIDWQFMVWNGDNWKRLSGMRPSLNPTDPADADKGPPTEIKIYTGGNINWNQVVLPDGVPVIDNRLETHGFSINDGVVVEGKLIDVSTGKPLVGTVVVERIEPQAKGGYDYTETDTTTTDVKGEWTLKGIPEGWYRLITESEGYLPRIVGYVKHNGQPRWQSFECKLAKGGVVTGCVTNSKGEPLEDVHVRLSDTSPAGGGRYDAPKPYETTTDECGEFEITAPVGTASIRIHKPGWCRPGLGPEISVPADNVELEMVESSNITAIVLFQSADVPDQYMVQLEPEGGSAVGKWSGSATIDENNQYIFENVPPGRYHLWGHPNPYSEREKTEPMLLDLKGGETIVKTIVVAE